MDDLRPQCLGGARSESQEQSMERVPGMTYTDTENFAYKLADFHAEPIDSSGHHDTATIP
jgi:hypothetical protein